MARPRKKAIVTWLGEDHLHVDPDGNPLPNSYPPAVNIWNGIKFPKGEPVEIEHPHMIAKAKKNPFFEVDGVRSEDADDAESAGG